MRMPHNPRERVGTNDCVQAFGCGYGVGRSGSGAQCEGADRIKSVFD